ncbi:MAG: hypothetical protein CTY34_03860 [Methylobacter sp.]|nr:MAG: hypothetical protein CTY34_03860 [Methylobacter sp.]PPD23800.1 MAG: hypothetical protein CTY24_03225 [Methylobacter sp.]PPD34410.1 MAG: hypothetical protein CTY18_08425 [Methylomonas sp.]
MTTVSFSRWIAHASWLIAKAPALWLSYTVALGILMILSRVSLALGVVIAVTGLFLAVGLAKYVDLKMSQEPPVSFFWALKRSLPLAILAAVGIVTCWFVFRLVATLFNGDYEKIILFFFNWELLPENLDDKPLRQLFGWFYGYASATLLFVMLMLISFASWFSHPLMLFNNRPLTSANRLGNKATEKHRGAILKLWGFIFVLAFFGAGILPMLVPFLYTFTALLMYTSYQSIFKNLDQ